MGVGAEHDPNPMGQGSHQAHVVQVKAAGLTVQLQQTAVVSGRLANGLQVQIVALALANQATAGMTDGTDVRMPNGVEQSFRDLVAWLILTVVDGGDYPVGLSETSNIRWYRDGPDRLSGTSHRP
jgi:hypothetical protein